MKKTNSNLMLINVVFVTCLIIANVVSARVIQTGVTLFDNPVTIPGAVFCYCLTFLSTDIISELWGKEEANRTVKLGFVAQILATLLIIFTGYLPVAPGYEATGEAYTTLLGQNVWFCLGSMISYLVSQTWDVKVFHKVREWLVNKTGSNKHRWLYNNISTMTSQVWDTVIFIVIAFGFGLRLPMPALINMCIGQYVFKFALAALDTPIFYLLTKTRKED